MQIKVRPDIASLIGVGDSRFQNHVTAGQAEGIMARNSCLVLTGVVITNPETEERWLVDNARCRWLDRDDWHTLLNPPQPFPSSQPKPVLSYS